MVKISETQSLDFDKKKDIYIAKAITTREMSREDMLRRVNSFRILKAQAKKNLKELVYIKRNFRTVLKGKAEKLRQNLKEKIKNISQIKEQIQVLKADISLFDEVIKKDEKMKEFIEKKKKEQEEIMKKEVKND